MGQFIPQCDEDGFYTAKQCREAVCYCVDNHGKTLGFHTNIGLARNMNCKCARERDAYQKSGLLGKMFRCDAVGNYDTVQCVGSVCYCADENGSELLGAGAQKVHISEMHKLRC